MLHMLSTSASGMGYSTPRGRFGEGGYCKRDSLQILDLLRGWHLRQNCRCVLCRVVNTDGRKPNIFITGDHTIIKMRML